METTLQPSFFSAITAFAGRHRLSKRLPYVLCLCAVLSGIATYSAITSAISLADRTARVLPFIYIDAALLLLLIVIIAKKLVELWQERRRGLRGAKLHVHIVVLFALVSITPTIIMSLFAAPLFFNVGLQTWFGQPVREAIEEAREVANAYLQEHQRSIIIDAHAIVNNLRPYMPVFMGDSEALNEILNNTSDERGLAELIVFTGQGSVVGRSFFSFALEFELLPREDLERAYNEGVVVNRSGNRVRVLVRLDPVTDTYLFVGKVIDQTVLQHVSRTESAVEDYAALRAQHSGAHIVLVIFFALVAILLLLAAIGVGLSIANTMVQPIQQLVLAADDVSQGNLLVKVDESNLNNELDDLIKSFNRMTRRLYQQNQELMVSQRKAAWADVARKIAHEIKNPLTPIQLSAERLKRRYLQEITSDPQTFQDCVGTIIRQVDHIGKLVNEFSAFARMPEARIESTAIIPIAHEALMLERQAHPEIEFTFTHPDDVIWPCDRQQISQVLTNILQNAINALTESGIKKSKIYLNILNNEDELTIICDDNGPGFPKEHRERLMEPYYTTREKGTGLGLAIVSKIVCDHNGVMELTDSDLGGARVTLRFKTKKDGS
jgi:nitrogen fixation/metabolism regulation signal transduction histidine kinase